MAPPFVDFDTVQMVDPAHGPRTVILERADAVIQISHGSLETPYVGPTEILPSPEAARHRLHRLVNRFERKGYVLNLRNAELEKPLAMWPDAPEPYLVYADWLEAHGDPRGELIRLQLALEGTPDDPVLLAREAELIDQHRVRLVPLCVQDPVWRRGFLLGFRVVSWTSWTGAEPPSWVRRRIQGELAAARRHASGWLAAWVDLVGPQGTVRFHEDSIERR